MPAGWRASILACHYRPGNGKGIRDLQSYRRVREVHSKRCSGPICIICPYLLVKWDNSIMVDQYALGYWKDIRDMQSERRVLEVHSECLAEPNMYHLSILASKMV